MLFRIACNSLTFVPFTESSRIRSPFIFFALPCQLSEYERKLFGKTSIRFPENEPITFNTEYEWLHADGTWVKQVIVR